jgi:pheromone alpha factor receptor
MASTLPPGFDTHTQNFTLVDEYGEQFVTNMGEVDYMRQYGIRVAINWGSQIGASIVLLLVLLLLTRREKRKSSIFIMNCLCLVLNAVRSVLQCIWLTTEMFHPYAVLAGEYSRVSPSNRANSIASNTVLLLLVACIMISLSLQVWVVCITAKPLHRAIIMGTTSLVACVAMGYRFAVCVLSNIRTMQNLTMTAYDGLVTDMHITQAVAVWFYCCVFTFKLGHALIQRKRMRMTQFGPMQIIFIMGCQTMVIPGMFLRCYFHGSD